MPHTTHEPARALGLLTADEINQGRKWKRWTDRAAQVVGFEPRVRRDITTAVSLAVLDTPGFLGILECIAESHPVELGDLDGPRVTVSDKLVSHSVTLVATTARSVQARVRAIRFDPTDSAAVSRRRINLQQIDTLEINMRLLTWLTFALAIGAAIFATLTIVHLAWLWNIESLTK